MPSELVIVPVYNEEASVEKVVRAIRKYTAADILCIDDGSTDASGSLLLSLRDWLPGLLVLCHPRNQGYGQTLIDGFDYAVRMGYEYAVTIDCDEQHEPCLIPGFLEDVRKLDIVSGSRYLQPVLAEGEVPPDRLRINGIITALINEVTDYSLTDAFCGFKAYRVAALSRLHLSETGYAFPLQFWIQAARHGLSLRERPIPLIYKINFERRFGGGLDDAEHRLAYYRQVVESELARQEVS